MKKQLFILLALALAFVGLGQGAKAQIQNDPEALLDLTEESADEIIRLTRKLSGQVNALAGQANGCNLNANLLASIRADVSRIEELSDELNFAGYYLTQSTGLDASAIESAGQNIEATEDAVSNKLNQLEAAAANCDGATAQTLASGIQADLNTIAALANQALVRAGQIRAAI